MVFDCWKWFNKNGLIDVFSNLYIVLKIYLTIPSLNFSGKRAFSKFYSQEQEQNNYKPRHFNSTNDISI